MVPPGQSRPRRVARHAWLVPVLLAAGCGELRTTSLDDRPPAPAPKARLTESYQQGVSQLDLLFVIDDSEGMGPAQARLAEAVEPFLEELNRRQLDWRAGVVSSDLGIQPHAGPGCSGAGKAGVLQSQPRWPGCSGPGLAYLSSSSAGDASRFGCIARLGEDGCGFERPWQAALLALEPAHLPAANRDFLRPGSGLLIVFLTDEDDCSASDPSLYDPDNPGLGAWDSFRCFQHDVTCSGQLEDGTLTGCHSGGSLLLPVGEAAARLRALRPAEGTLQVLALAGPGQPVRLGGSEPAASVQPSCSAGELEARPGLRFSELAGSLGGSAELASFCQPDQYGSRLAGALARLQQPPYHCLPHPLQDPYRPGCAVEVTDPEGRRWGIPPATPAAPGFQLLHPVQAGCPTGALAFDAAAVPPQGATVELTCDFKVP